MKTINREQIGTIRVYLPKRTPLAPVLATKISVILQQTSVTAAEVRMTSHRSSQELTAERHNGQN